MGICNGDSQRNFCMLHIYICTTIGVTILTFEHLGVDEHGVQQFPHVIATCSIMADLCLWRYTQIYVHIHKIGNMMMKPCSFANLALDKSISVTLRFLSIFCFIFTNSFLSNSTQETWEVSHQQRIQAWHPGFGVIPWICWFWITTVAC